VRGKKVEEEVVSVRKMRRWVKEDVIVDEEECCWC